MGTTITSAFIDLVSRRTLFNTTNTTIVGQLIDDASIILAPSCPTCFCGINNAACLYFFSMFTSTFDITGRGETIASVAWNGIPVAATGVTLTSPDISSIVQEIVDRPGWASGNDMFFRLQNANAAAYREFLSFEDDPAVAPRIRITIPSSGSSVEGDDQMIALRFTDLNIPQGATLTEAILTLTPSAAPATGLESTWEISAEQTDDSEALEDSVANISSRSSGGTSVSWTLGTSDLIIQDEPEESIDLKAVLQDVIG